MCLLPVAAIAQGFPSKPLRLILRAIGSTDDTQARLLAAPLKTILGQQVIIDFRVGAGGLIAAEYVAKSPPDGYVMLLTASGLASVKSLRSDSPVDPWRDFAWVSQVSSFMLVLSAHPTLPVKNIKDLIALARMRPGELSYGSSGIGATPHLAAEYFKSAAKLNINHVPYKGGAGMFIDLMGGRVELGSSTTAPAIPLIRSGKLRALGVTGARRSPELPDVPTIAEGAGLPGFEFTGFYAIAVPGGTPQDVVATLSNAIIKAMATPGFREQFMKAVPGLEPVSSTPEQLLKLAKTDAAKVDQIVRSANIKPE